MVRITRLVCAAALAAALLIGHPLLVSPADAAPEGPFGREQWRYSEDGNGYFRTPGRPSSATSGGVPLVRTETDRRAVGCVEGPDRRCDGFGALTCGSGIGPRGRPWFARVTYRRESPMSPWRVDGHGCTEVGDDDWVSMREISYRVDYDLFQPLGRPALVIGPKPSGAVNSPVEVSTTYPEGLRGPAQILSLHPVKVRIPVRVGRPGGGLDGEIVATAEFTWTFQDGGTAHGRGRPTAGSADSPDAGTSVSHVFRTPGRKNIHLQVEWTGTVTIRDSAPERIDPIHIDADATIEVNDLVPASGR